MSRLSSILFTFLLLRSTCQLEYRHFRENYLRDRILNNSIQIHWKFVLSRSTTICNSLACFIPSLTLTDIPFLKSDTCLHSIIANNKLLWMIAQGYVKIQPSNIYPERLILKGFMEIHTYSLCRNFHIEAQN